MSPIRLPQLGSVIWAEVEDANGFRKVRPAIVLTATADIAADKPLRLAAITTRLPTPLPDDHVLLPWDRQGKARTGLRRHCAAVATWQVEISAGDVRQVVGVLPPGVIRELLAKIASSLPSLTPPTDAKGAATDQGSNGPPPEP